MQRQHEGGKVLIRELGELVGDLHQFSSALCRASHISQFEHVPVDVMESVLGSK